MCLRSMCRLIGKLKLDHSLLRIKTSVKSTRLLPSYLDRESFNQIMVNEKAHDQTSFQARAFEFFTKRASNLDADQCLEYLNNSLQKMSMTLVLIQNDINMPQVFLWLQEKGLFSMGSLLHNPSPGEDLLAQDLIRNLIMACVANWDIETQEKFHMENWLKPIEFKVKDLNGLIVKFNESYSVKHVSSVEKFIIEATKTRSGRDKKTENSRMYGKFYSIYEERMMKFGKTDEISNDNLLKVSLQILHEMAALTEHH